jgi:hypothetical protein
MMRIDFHTHVYPDPIAPQVVAQIQAELGLSAVISGKAGDLLLHLDEQGFDAAVVLGVAPMPRLVERTNQWLRDLAAAHPRLIPFATLHPDYPDYEAELARLQEWGFRGLKVHPLIQHAEPDDPRWYRIYAAVPADFLVLFHAGFGTAEKHNRSTPQQLAGVRRDFPHLRMIIAHWGGVDQQDAVWEHLIGQDIYFDTSCPPGLDQFAPDYLMRFIRAHGAERILFGSDSPFGHTGKDATAIAALPLGAQTADILGGNARRLLKV